MTSDGRSNTDREKDKEKKKEKERDSEKPLYKESSRKILKSSKGTEGKEGSLKENTSGTQSPAKRKVSRGEEGKETTRDPEGKDEKREEKEDRDRTASSKHRRMSEGKEDRSQIEAGPSPKRRKSRSLSRQGNRSRIDKDKGKDVKEDQPPQQPQQDASRNTDKPDAESISIPNNVTKQLFIKPFAEDDNGIGKGVDKDRLRKFSSVRGHLGHTRKTTMDRKVHGFIFFS